MIALRDLSRMQSGTDRNITVLDFIPVWTKCSEVKHEETKGFGPGQLTGAVTRKIRISLTRFV
jgi:hypothetical protein